MIHHLFVLDFVMIIILQKQKRQNCMKAKILFRVLLMIICIAGAYPLISWKDSNSYKFRRFSGSFLVLMLAIPILFSSCNSRNTKEEMQRITVKSSSDRIVSEWLDSIKVDVWAIHTDVPVAPIQSMDVIGNKCFVLDVFKRIFLIDIEKRLVLKSDITLGNARNEMLSPICLTADEEHVYVYDGMKECIFVLSYDLKLCQIVNTGCFFSTFRKIDNGFACLSMGSEQNFLFLRDDGVPVYSKKLSDKYPDEIQDGNPIQIGMDGYPYVKAYYSDTVFKWNGQELVESVQFDYGMGEPGGDYQKGSQLAHSGIAYTESYFLTNTHVLSSFVETDGRTIHYNLYDKENGVSCSGKMAPIDNVYFRATLQHGKEAYAVVLADEACVYGLKDIDMNNIVIIRYTFPS